MNLIYFLLIGLIAGWLSGRIMKGKGFGLVGNLIIGCIGACLGGVLFSLLELRTTGFIGTLISATVGAILLILVIRKLKNV